VQGAVHHNDPLPAFFLETLLSILAPKRESNMGIRKLLMNEQDDPGSDKLPSIRVIVWNSMYGIFTLSMPENRTGFNFTGCRND